ncbi:MAG: helix-turn-helix transcriptional regulator [Clostridia bacterium]|nr:helix-turn-helix transcriptional regulator [Clostridia bacterium]
MYFNSGYLNNSKLPFKDKSRPLIVGSCGTYRLRTKKKLPTWMPRGRPDYQLLYVAAGKTHFFINGEDTVVSAGHMVLYHPKEEQHYEYYGEDKPEVYWVHFTGSDVRNILRHYDIPLDEHVFFCGTPTTYAMLFKQMIDEFQNCRVGYQEMLEMCFRQLLMVVQRTRLEKPPIMNSAVMEEMNSARQYFHEHYNEPISVEEFAQSRHVSISLFMRNFKKVYGVSPKQYILNQRMNNAQSLLETTDYTVTEIAAIVGYDNPLYFSRLYHKQKGQSPSDYRKLLKEQ